MQHDDLYALMVSRTLGRASLNDIVGGGDPREQGERAAALVRSEGALAPASRVLEVGSGCGRAAVALLDDLPEGSYVGVDIVPGLTRFCADEITPLAPQFTFRTLREGNPQYAALLHGDGATPISELREAGTDFDLTFAFSLFTHLQPEEAASMLRRMSEVTAPGGRLLLTAFLLDPQSRRAIDEGRAAHFVGARRASRAEVLHSDFNGPNSAVAYDTSYLLQLLHDAGFDAALTLRFGSWRALEAPDFQDVVVATRALRLPDGFDGKRYLRLHRDVARFGMNPAHHYLVYGRAEGRAW